MNYTSFDNIGLVRILSFLKSHNNEYLSGQDLSDILKISRVAVWKHIKKIKSLGYKIESKQKLGYKLVGRTDLPLPWELVDGLETKTLGKRVYYFDYLDSTQNFASKISNEEEGTTILAKKQSDGRGRLGRRWISPEGGIWMSVIFHPKFDANYSTIFPLMAGLALANTIKRLYDVSPKLKWPNDVTVDGKKVAGILTDASFESNKVSNIILGIGINYSVDEKTLERSLKGNPNFYGVTSLPSLHVSRIQFIQKLLEELEIEYENLTSGKIKQIVKDWTRDSETIGNKIKVVLENNTITGIAEKIDNDGSLVLKSDNKVHRIISGDISRA